MLSMGLEEKLAKVQRLSGAKTEREQGQAGRQAWREVQANGSALSPRSQRSLKGQQDVLELTLWKGPLSWCGLFTEGQILSPPQVL